jgi:MAF protein
MIIQEKRMKKKKIILGSSSKFRKSLLKTLNIDFVCISPEIDESRLPEEGPRDMVLRLAIEKAKKISLLENNSLIISSDSCASCDGRILGKPLSEIKAVEHLEYISVKNIVFYTGICVLNSGLMDFKTDIAKYKIKIKKLSSKDILDYVKKHNPINSSAAFRYEVAKDILIEEFIDTENDISGLIGLPLKKLKVILDSYEL